MPSGNFTKEWIKTTCGYCNKELEFTSGDYNQRIKRNKNGSIFCSDSCRTNFRSQNDERNTRLVCKNCNIDFTDRLNKYEYRRKIKSDQDKFCSVVCSNTFKNQSQFMKDKIREKQLGVECPQRGRKDKVLTEEHKQKISESRKELFEKQNNISNRVECKCASCGKIFNLIRWIYNKKIKRSVSGNIYCSLECSTKSKIGISRPDEIKEKIRISQTGKSKPTVGRLGHMVTEETRIKISESKTGITVKPDWDIVVEEVKRRGISKYVITRAPVPDAIFLEDGKLIALELEKKPLFNDVKRKMELYIQTNLQHHTGYDKVILVWYNMDKKFMGEWWFENNKWTKL